MYEEERLLYMWRRNLKGINSTKHRHNVIKSFETRFAKEGIYVSAANINAKMSSLKRRYFCIGSDTSQQKKWNYYKRMCAIMSYVPETVDKQIIEDEVATNDSNDMGYTQKENTEEYPTKKALPKKKKRKPWRNNRASAYRKHKRKTWTEQEEKILLEVWQKYLQALQSEQRNIDIYKNMGSDLYNLGIDKSVNGIKAKIRSLSRIYRNQQQSKNPDKDWVHYDTMAELLEHSYSDEPAERSESTRLFNESDSWLNDIASSEIYIETDISPIMNPKIDYNNDEIDDIICFDSCVNPQNSKSTVENNLENSKSTVENNPHICKTSFEDDDCTIVPNNTDYLDIESDNIKNISIEETVIAECSTLPLPRSQLTIEFGQFVTKELNMLNDDLLIEAKRQIYNIICAMQIKQLQVNKNT